MDYVDELTSGRTPLVKKAAKKILKGRLIGENYEVLLCDG